MLNSIVKTFDRYLWHRDLQSLPAPKRLLIFWLRLIQVLIQDFATGQITLRAMGLVYTTLLSIVPLLAFVFAVLKALGVQQNIKPLLLNFLAPLGAQAAGISTKIVDFVDNVKAGVLGVIGLLVLIYAVISLVQKVESGLNYIWRVREARTLGERFSHYLSVILVGPVLLVSALAITATVSSHSVTQHILDIAPFGRLLVMGIKIVPYLLVSGAFTFIYAIVPHTHVRFRAALVGGVCAGVIWEFASWAFAALTVSSTRLTVIYSGFAILIMFMAWLYLCWLILLVGAQVAFYIQNPELVRHGHDNAGGRTLERLALHAMYFIGRCFYASTTPWSREELAQRLRVPTDTALDILGRLCEARLIMLISGRIRRYVPARDMNTITLRDIVNAVRLNPPDTLGVDQYMKGVDPVDRVIKAMDQALDEALGETTLYELVAGQPATDDVPSAPP